MKINKVSVSIVIVNYRVEKELLNCIVSIIRSRPEASFEIIVVDNDKNDKLRQNLKSFSHVKYIESSKNIGFGAGNNLGAKFASGEYLFFLNPDTIVKKEAVDMLYGFLKKNSSAGMAAPLLLDPSGNVYPDQGSSQYSLISAVITSSFVNKLFPNNIISKHFFHRNWTKKKTEEFDVVPGTAFMIKKDLFEKIGMFDEKIFLYFEEYDLAKRIKKLGNKNYIIPQAKILHIWEASAKQRGDINKIFSQSRHYFFKKNYGVFFAFVVKLISNIGKHELLFGLVFVLSLFLSSFKIRELMPFIGDQGWFYLSARDFLINGQIPLVGIASSHPWLHQGPFWTYLLIPFLWLFNFDPISGAYIAMILGVLSVIGIYVVGSSLFSKRVGLIASLLYATSPLAVYYMRFPYHTTPIPLFVIFLIFSLSKVVQNKLTYLPLTIMLLSVLYNFEIATVILEIALVLILAYKLFKKGLRFKEILNRKILTLSTIALLIPLLPMILYDIKNGFPQTFRFGIWIMYRFVSLFSYNSDQTFSLNKIKTMFIFLFDNFKRLIYPQNDLTTLVIFICLTIGMVNYLFQKRKKSNSYNLIFLLFILPLVFIILNQTPSDAYLPMLFPTVILIFSSFLDYFITTRRMLILILIFITIIVFGNINFMLKNNFMFNESSKLFTLGKRVKIAHQILNIAEKKDYNLQGKGPGSEFNSFTMNYEYLTWWLGHGPSKKNESLRIYVSESINGPKIEEENIGK